MKLTSINFNEVEIQFLLKDLEMFHNIIKEVELALPKSDFEIRLGASSRQARAFFETILKNIKQSGESEIKISLSHFEMYLLNDLLNEACHGISIPNFESKIGVSKQEAVNLLNLVYETRRKICFRET
ncbi:MAG: hypothetical protein SXA11_24530 [Cyanobacteriota bacterium]|nr:hypothetical protein [Cyanobacteriota bacterium]